MDLIHIRDLEVMCIIGTKPEEREHPQRVLVNITLGCNLTLAGRSDNLDDTVNYRALKDQVVDLVERSQCYLVERLAEQILTLCLQTRKVETARVSLEKPDALTGARSVGVELYRERRGR